jgi:hypothetical protein
MTNQRAIANNIRAIMATTEHIEEFLQILLAELGDTTASLLFWDAMRRITVGGLNKGSTPAQRVKAMKILAAIARKGDIESTLLLFLCEREDPDVSVRTTCTALLTEIRNMPDGFAEDRE